MDTTRPDVNYFCTYTPFTTTDIPIALRYFMNLYVKEYNKEIPLNELNVRILDITRTNSYEDDMKLACTWLMCYFMYGQVASREMSVREQVEFSVLCRELTTQLIDLIRVCSLRYNINKTLSALSVSKLLEEYVNPIIGSTKSHSKFHSLGRYSDNIKFIIEMINIDDIMHGINGMGVYLRHAGEDFIAHSNVWINIAQKNIEILTTQRDDISDYNCLYIINQSLTACSIAKYWTAFESNKKNYNVANSLQNGLLTIDMEIKSNITRNLFHHVLGKNIMSKNNIPKVSFQEYCDVLFQLNPFIGFSYYSNSYNSKTQDYGLELINAINSSDTGFRNYIFNVLKDENHTHSNEHIKFISNNSEISIIDVRIDLMCYNYLTFQKFNNVLNNIFFNSFLINLNRNHISYQATKQVEPPNETKQLTSPEKPYKFTTATTTRMVKSDESDTIRPIKLALNKIISTQGGGVDLIEFCKPDFLRTELLKEFPWMEDAINLITEEMQLSIRLSGKNNFIRPIVFVGPAGVGKSRFMSRLADYLGVPSITFSCASANDAMNIKGSSNSWSQSTCSLPVRMISMNGVGNPAIILDEVDKIMLNSNNGNIVNAVLPMLEPGTNQKYNDDYFMENFNISGVIWLMTANVLKDISPILLSRCKVIHITSPRPIDTDFEAIRCGIVKDMCLRYSCEENMLPELPREFIKEIRSQYIKRSLSARGLFRMFMAAYTQAAVYENEQTKH